MYTLSVHSTCGKLIESTFPYCVLFLTQNLAINILSAPYEPNHSAKTCQFYIGMQLGDTKSQQDIASPTQSEHKVC